MNEREKGLTFYKNGEGKTMGIKFYPSNFTFRALIRMSAFQFTNPRLRMCVIRSGNEGLNLSSDYITQVQQLPPELKMVHVVDTAIQMRRGDEVFVHFKGEDKA